MPELSPQVAAEHAAEYNAPRRLKSTESERLAGRIERAIRRATGDRVRTLQVEVHEKTIILQGRCGTFYCKQLSQHAALAMCDGRTLQNQIEVW